MTEPADSAPAPKPNAQASLANSWICAGIGLGLLLAYAFLTNPNRAITEQASPARIGMTAAIIAGGILFWGIFRGITGPAFTKPAVINAALLALVAPAAIRAWLIANRADDAANVKALTIAVRAYADDYAGHPPPSLATIFHRPGLTPAHFQRPGSGAPAPTPAELTANPDAADYLLLAPPGPLDLDAATPIICSHPGGLGSWINVGYANGAIRGHRADSVAAATGVTGREPPEPPPLPSIEELKARRHQGSEQTPPGEPGP